MLSAFWQGIQNFWYYKRATNENGQTYLSECVADVAVLAFNALTTAIDYTLLINMIE